jgi:Holliday junction DNA helicase RuvA
VDDLVPAVRSGDLARLTRIPGVGRKTAERMIVELRDKLAGVEISEDAHKPVATTSGGDEVVFALTNLGYDRSVAENAVKAVRSNGNAIDFDPLLRASLRWLRNPKARASRTSE